MNKVDYKFRGLWLLTSSFVDVPPTDVKSTSLVTSSSVSSLNPQWSAANVSYIHVQPKSIIDEHQSSSSSSSSASTTTVDYETYETIDSAASESMSNVFRVLFQNKISYVLSNAVSVQSFCCKKYNNFIVRYRIPNFHYHGNKCQSMANFSDTVILSALKDPLFGARLCTISLL